MATETLCYSALHPQEPTDQVLLARYKQRFVEFQSILGAVALRKFEREFEDVLSIGTPSAIFKGYFDAFRNGLRNLVQQFFGEALQIGIANAGALDTHPVEWAKAHLKFLVRTELPHVVRWIKSACDGQLPPHNDDPLSWKTWRAPGLVHMQPSSHATFDPESAWRREDEQHTQELLTRRSNTFIQLLELDLDSTASNAHVACAKRGIPRAQAKERPSRPEGSQERESEQRSSRSNQKHEKTKLGPKKQDLTRYLDSVDLTPRQRECISLRLEYGLTKTAIAQRLGIHRTTFDEHFSAAEKKLKLYADKERADKNLAKVKPGSIRTR